MTTLASALKKEIQVQAARAVRTQVLPLEKELKAERLRVRDLERQVKTLTTRLNRVATKKALPLRPVQEAFQASSVTALRDRFGLTQAALAKILGVGLNTVWLWEQGRTRPRSAQQAALKELAGLSQAGILRRLKAVGLDTGRNKPGRKKGSTKAVLAKKATRRKAARKKTPTRKKATTRPKVAKKTRRKARSG